MRASRAKVAALQETAMTTGTPEPASFCACASAPCRGGSKIAASKDFSSGSAKGRRNRSRISAVTGLRPAVALAAAPSAASAAGSTSAAVTGREHRAAVDIDDAVAAIGRKSHLENVVAARTGVEHGAAAPFPMRIDEIADRSLQPRLRQGLDHQPAFPRAIARKLPMLE